MDENKVKKATEKEVFQKVAGEIVENFVATYEAEGECSLIMRLLNGQKFRITVEEVY